MAVNSKRKGSQWERDCARKLSLIISAGTHDDIFWRTASSGALATITGEYNEMRGDLFVAHPAWKSKCNEVIECKCLAKQSIIPMTPQLRKIIDVCFRLYALDWILALKITNKGEYLISPKYADCLVMENTKTIGFTLHYWEGATVLLFINSFEKKE